MDLAVRPLALLLQQVDVRLDLLERLLQRLHDDAEPPHRLLGEEAFALSPAGASVESALIGFAARSSKASRAAASAPSLSAERPLRPRAPRPRAVARRHERVAVREARRSASVDADGADDEPDQECDDGHEGIAR